MLSYNVADLLRSAPGTSESQQVDVPSLSIAEDVELAAPVTGELRLINSGRSILVQGTLHTALAERCSRCLRPAQAPLEVVLEEEALPSVELEDGSPLETGDEPDALRLTDHHELELEGPVRDAISLAEPIAPLCRSDCPGLCETCGIDLTDNPGHEHPGEDIDPRLAALAGIRERLN